MLGVILLLAAVAAAAPDEAAFVQSGEPIGTPTGQQCGRIVRPLPSGAYISAQDVVAAVCTASVVPRPFRFERSVMAARAIRDLSPGDLVPTLPKVALPAVVPGETLLLAAQVGNVQLTRSVRALQAASPGQRLFVQSRDGEVFAVTCPEQRP